MSTEPETSDDLLRVAQSLLKQRDGLLVAYIELVGAVRMARLSVEGIGSELKAFSPNLGAISHFLAHMVLHGDETVGKIGVMSEPTYAMEQRLLSGRESVPASSLH